MKIMKRYVVPVIFLSISVSAMAGEWKGYISEVKENEIYVIKSGNGDEVYRINKNICDDDPYLCKNLQIRSGAEVEFTLGGDPTEAGSWYFKDTPKNPDIKFNHKLWITDNCIAFNHNGNRIVHETDDDDFEYSSRIYYYDLRDVKFIKEYGSFSPKCKDQGSECFHAIRVIDDWLTEHDSYYLRFVPELCG